MYYPGQRVIARDGAHYVLAFLMEGVWFAVPAGGAATTTPGRSLPRPIEPRYPCWGDDDERGGADLAPQQVRRVRARAGRSRELRKS